ncbi:DUF1707 SHOCT-like domain-containing protein [Bailinhaonella thermotolerans]|uniref:DUF1707 domain-containing protein n=1 Tax=Bailinhaonella thermotolerans TaxID=1070861 RepID=A0A3A4A6P6_9ACTN|nr:DUF1707 domain-containing protein [Bailinhaonella thermotolerans]RJL23539.1 DUF1707 domain-containing protein [Bailinhaonella thermotolerans]
MANAPEMRASDRDRDRVAEALREHCAQGRLTVDEFHERLEHLYQAKTLGQLAEITSDLPDIDLHQMRAPEPQAAKPPAEKDSGMRAAWASWASVTAITTAIWAIICVTAGELIYFWPIWVAGPWGAVLLVASIFGEGRKKT